MRLRVLGPVEIESDDGQVHTLARRQERCLLAMLALNAGRTVTVDRLCDLLWDDNPPPRARRGVHAHVARIRATLARAGADAAGAELVTSRDGYLLRVDPDAVDAHRFRSLVERAGGTADARQRDRLLRDALALWRGPALHQAATSERIRQQLCADLEERRLQALEASLATGMELGRHRELVPELARLTAEHPNRERLVELHMLALYRSGRTVDALDVYTRTRTRLAEELGLDPGPALRDLQQAILRGTPALAATPAPAAGAAVRPGQLPPDQAGFTGRSEYLDRLDELLANGTAVVISAIAGTAGVGKTALAVHWAHRVRDRFPDGQLYVNLRGYAPGPAMRPIDALAGFLAALDVPAERVPADVDQATALYRTLLADRRMLVLLDNAAGADQVRPLLPGARGCLVLVTSRDRLGGLVAREGAHASTLDVLTSGEARTLLAGVIGADRVAAEPDAAAELARLCAHLPLALRIAAANLGEYPDRRIADHVDALRADDRLSALAVAGDDDTAVRAAFDLSYAALPARARLLFGRLGLVPGTDVTPAAAAALTGGTVDDVVSTVDTLVAAHLLTEAAPGRYTNHDLLRRYAVERVRADESAAEREAATRRLYDYYTGTVDAAVDLLKPGTVRLPREPAGSVPFDRAQALAWLDAERSNLVAAVVAAADEGPLPAAWHLADAMRGYFWLRIALPDWLAVSRAGLAAAEAGGDVPAQAAGQLNLADALTRQGRMRDAVHHYGRALDLFARAGWDEGEAAAANNLGITHGILGELAEAAGHFRRALEIRRRLGQLHHQASALLNLAFVHYPAGQLAAAADYAAESVALCETADFRQGLGVALCSLGGSRLSLGQPEEARQLLSRALTLSRETGDRTSEAMALLLFAALYRDTGRHTEALARAEEARAIATDTVDRRLEADALVTLGSVHERMGHTGEAIDHAQRGLAIARDLESPALEAEALISLGAAHVDAGDLDQARRYAETAVAVADRAGHLLREGRALTLLALVDVASGRPDDAVERGRAALKVHCDTGFRFGQAQTHAVLGDAFERTGRPELAGEHRVRARELYAEIGAEP